ncbi:MAG: DUF3050 domain-containing protein [Planctomycetota bacterium]|jgi:hypothetical protein
MTEIDRLRDALAPLRQQLLNHRLYGRLHSLEAMHVFMQHHVFAVWDFMSLLKSLQRELTCLNIPWRPSPSPTGSRLINEITLGEESDDDGQGGFASHFELYLSAMEQAGADTSSINSVIASLEVGSTRGAALSAASAPYSVCAFVDTTFEIIEKGGVCAVASAFTFGREDLLPDVFQEIVTTINASSDGRLDRFEFYLQRHIELDGDQHGGMAQQLVEELCGDDANRWTSARTAAVRSLEARLQLWDTIADRIDSIVPEPFLAGLS